MAFGSFGSSTISSSSNRDYEVQVPISDTIQDLSWSPTSNLLADGGWDGNVRCWEVAKNGNSFNVNPKAQIAHQGPVLCTAFSKDGSTVFSGSCDKTAKMWQLGGNGQGQQIASHEAPVKGIAQIQEMNCVVTGSWDKTVKYWDTRAPTAQATVQLPERCYGLDVVYPLMVVITADLNEVVFDLNSPGKIFRTRKSILKHQLRTVACHPNKQEYAVGSIEGRIGIHYVQDTPELVKKEFAFKCHRPGVSNEVYPVNGLSFNPLGTFASVGGDGTLAFWDKEERQRLQVYSDNKLPITACKFNAQGDIFAYATGYDWSKGVDGFNSNTKSSLWLHNVTKEDVVYTKKNSKLHK